MTEENMQQLWKNYQDAWADISLAERQRLIRASVAEDVVFTNPSTKGQGLQNLLTNIGEFQTQFPGAYFRSNRLLEQHGQLLSEWTMFNKDGSEFLTAHSYACFNDEERLTYLGGFWKL
ncbi:hypothetical protein [Granulicella arctica]|uniref:hypothetical protein n=1 Tax=Granulicella arctica TaxID=940613 RepID=UPI0021DFF5DE|nr:hypothetical protein [Granulicella arctica]